MNAYDYSNLDRRDGLDTRGPRYVAAIDIRPAPAAPAAPVKSSTWPIVVTVIMFFPVLILMSGIVAIMITRAVL